MAKKSAKVEKAENPEKVEALTPPIGNPKLLAKLQKLAADSGISVQELVNLKMDELRHGLPAETVTQPAKTVAPEKIATQPAMSPSDPIAKMWAMVENIEEILKVLNFRDKRDFEIVMKLLKILQAIHSLA